MTHPSISILLLFSISISIANAVSSCDASGSTFYDGYLDTFLYSAQFERSSNSFFKFTNPYYGLDPISTTSISFWIKHSEMTSDEASVEAYILDCSDIMGIRTNNYTYYYKVDISNSDNIDLSSVQSEQIMSSWNNYVFTYISGERSIYLNGQLLTQDTIGSSTITTNSPMCTIGNNMNLDTPFSGYLRHFYFSKEGWSSSTDIYNTVHHIVIPQNPSTLAYFQFSKNFLFGEQYAYNVNNFYQPDHITIVQSDEPEFVCYCTGFQPNYLNISSSYQLNSFSFSAKQTVNKLTKYGFTLDFLIYAQKQATDQDETLLYISDYASIGLTNNSNTITLTLYADASTTSTYSFKSFQFRYNYWTWYTIRVTTSSIFFWVDGNLITKFSGSFTLNTNNPDEYQILPPQSISYLISNTTVRNGALSRVGHWDCAQNNLDSQISAQVGDLSFGSSNTLCYSTQANKTDYWTGQNCKDQRLFPKFNSEGSNPVSLKSNIYSSSEDMTVQLWLKDMNTESSKTSLLLENSIDGTNPLLQLALTSGTSTAEARTISCNPNMITLSTISAQISGLQTYNLWTHLSCVSSSKDQTTNAVFYSEQYGTLSAQQYSATFFQLENSIDTYIGSNVQGNNQFTGYLRELRFFDSPLTSEQIKNFRFQVLDSTSSKAYGLGSLLYYFKLSDEIDPYKIYDSAMTNSDVFFKETSTFNSLTTMVWSQEITLVVCQPGLYYNGQCCEEISIDQINKATFTLQYSASQNQIEIALDSSGMSDITWVFDSLQANFSLSSVRNNYQYNSTLSIEEYLAPYLQQDQSVGFTVSSSLINPLASSITIQAIIYSFYEPSLTITINKTLELDCPMLWLSILPDYYTDNTQIVSSLSTDETPQINAKIQDQCFNTQTMQSYYEEINDIQWQSNFTSSADYTESLFLVSSDKLAVTTNSIKPTFDSTNKYIFVSAEITYNSGQVTFMNHIYLDFQDYMIVYTPIISSSTMTLGQSLSMDLSSASVSPESTQYSQISYSVLCPSFIFYSSESMDSLCQIDSTGVFTISDTSQLNIVANYLYEFTVQMFINNTSIMTTHTSQFQFIKDGGSTNCPRLEIQSSYTFLINQDENLQLLPDAYLTCDGNENTVTSVEWTVIDSLGGTVYPNILSYGDQTIYKFANITPAAKVSNNILAGQKLNIGVKYTLSNDQSYTANTEVLFSQTLLHPSIELYGKNGLLSSNSISFIEQNMILDATSSYDPDNSSAQVFSFSWTCPSIMDDAYTCSDFASGSSNEYFQLNALQRAKISFSYNTIYYFNLTMTSVTNLYKTPVTLQYPVTFDPPQPDDPILNTEMQTDCVNINANGGALYENATKNTLKYDVSNYTNSEFNINAQNIDNCSYNYQEQLIVLYINDLGFFPLNSPARYLWSQTDPQISSSYMITPILSDMFDLLDKDISFDQEIVANIYYFSQLLQNPNTVFLSTDTFYIYRSLSSLVAQISPYSIQVDKYDTLYINASSSYDPDNLGLNYSYIWKCPSTDNNTACESQTSSELVLTFYDRYYSDTNQIDDPYDYSVQITDGDRISESTSAKVTVTQKDSYTSCVQLEMNTNDLNNFTDNQLYIQYNQFIPVFLNISIIQDCDAITFDNPTFNIISPQSASSLQPWIINSQKTNVATITQDKLSLLTPNTNYTVQFTQTFSLGMETTTKYTQKVTFYVMVTMPSLVFNYKGPMVSYFTSDQTSIVLDASESYDPANEEFSVTWDCPDQFGGLNCSQSLLNSLDFSTLESYSTNNNQQIDTFYNMSYEFKLTLTPALTPERTQTRSYYLFLTSEASSWASSDTTQCGIYSNDVNGGSSQVPSSKIVIFSFDCPDIAELNYPSIENDTMTWSISEFSEDIDYFQNSTNLFLDSFAASKLSSQNYITVSLQFSSLPNPLTRQFVFVKDQLTQGQISISPTPSIAYQPYTFTFSNYQTSYYYGMHFQLRRFNGQSDQIILPMKPFNSQYIGIMFTNLIVPSYKDLYVDFFDMNFNYMGSTNLTSQVITQMTESTVDDSTVNFAVTLLAKPVTNFNASKTSMAQFQQDLSSIMMFSEMLTMNLVNFDNLNKSQDDYTALIVNYLVNIYYPVVTNYYNNANPYDIYASISSQKIFVQIFQNILNLNASVVKEFDVANDLLECMNIVQANYTRLTTYGDDQQELRQSIISIMGMFMDQVNENIYDLVSDNQLFLQSKIQDFNEVFIQQDQPSVAGEVNSYIVGGQNVQMMILDTTAQEKTLNNSFSEKEYVQISDQSLLASYGVESLEVTFSFQQNISSAVSTLLDLNAYNSQYSLQSVNFTSQESNEQVNMIFENPRYGKIYQYFLKDDYAPSQSIPLKQSALAVNFQFEFKPEMKDLFNGNITSYDNTTTTQYIPYCVYYDPSTSQWSTEGVSTISFSTSEGIIQCSTTHFSTFSVDYSVATSNITTVSEQTYFLDQMGLFIASISGMTLIVCVLLLFSLKSFNNWDYNSPILYKNEEDFGFCSIVGSCFILYHPIVAALCCAKRNNINVSIMKFNKMITCWMTFFSLCFFVLLAFFLSPEHVSYDLLSYEPYYVYFIIYGAVLAGIVQIMRILLQTAFYAFYFMNATVAEYSSKKNAQPNYTIQSSSGHSGRKKRDQSNRSEQESLLSGSQASSKKRRIKKSSQGVKKSKSKEMREKYNFEIEGGSSEDDDRYQRPKKSRQRPQSNDQNLKSKSSNKYGSDGQKDIYHTRRNKDSPDREGGTRSKRNKYGNVAINDTTDYDSSIAKKKREKNDDGEPRSKRQVYESNFRGTQNPKKYADSSEDDMAGRPYKKFSSPEDNLSKKRSPQMGQSEKISSKQHTSKFKERGITKEKEKHRSRYEEDKLDTKSSYRAHDSSNIYRPSGRDSEQSSPSKYRPGKYDSTSRFKNPQSMNSTMSFGASKYSSNHSNSDEKSQIRKERRKHDSSPDEKIQQKGPKQLEDTNSPHFTGASITLTIITLCLLLGFMGSSYYLMTFLPDTDQVFYWLEIFLGTFIGQVFLLDTAYVFWFACIFKCSGPGTCARIAGTFFIGNAHRNIVDGLVYDLNNKNQNL